MRYVIKLSNPSTKYNKKCIIFSGEGTKIWRRDWRNTDVGGHTVRTTYRRSRKTFAQCSGEGHHSCPTDLPLMTSHGFSGGSYPQNCQLIKEVNVNCVSFSVGGASIKHLHGFIFICEFLYFFIQYQIKDGRTR